MQVSLRRIKDLLDRHPAHTRAILIVVVVGERMHDEHRQCSGDRRRGFESNRKYAVEITRGERQLLRSDRLGANAIDLAENLARRRISNV